MGAEMWAWRCQSAVANALRPGTRAAGRYVGIEMVAWIAERAGLPVGETVAQPAVIAALAALAARRAAELADARGAELDPRDPRVVELVYAVQTRVLFELGFEEQATFVFGREWPTRDGATLKANWALGMYLLRQDEARSAAAAGSA